jgi:hypothetical protein
MAEIRIFVGFMSDTVTRNISPSPEATDCQNQFVSQVSEKFSVIFPAK